MADHIMVRRFGRAEAVARSGRIAEIYGAALGRDAEPIAHFANTFRNCMESYAGATVLAALGGGEDGEVLGFLYGFDLQLQHWWPQQVAGPVRAAGHAAWLDDCFELVELEVDPAHQGRGIGTALLTRQLAEMSHRRAMLAADPEGRARGLYRRLGFIDLVPDFHYSGTAYRAALMGWDREQGPLSQAR